MCQPNSLDENLRCDGWQGPGKVQVFLVWSLWLLAALVLLVALGLALVAPGSHRPTIDKPLPNSSSTDSF